LSHSSTFTTTTLQTHELNQVKNTFYESGSIMHAKIKKNYEPKFYLENFTKKKDHLIRRHVEGGIMTPTFLG